MNNGPVANGAAVADGNRAADVRVQDAVILNVGEAAHHHVGGLGPQHGAEVDAAPLQQRDAAHHGGIGSKECGGGCIGGLNHKVSPPSGAAALVTGGNRAAAKAYHNFRRLATKTGAGRQSSTRKVPENLCDITKNLKTK